MNSITTHILDTKLGRPAAGVPVVLEKQKEANWEELARAVTNRDGRTDALVPPGSLDGGVYRLNFATGAYFASQHTATFYPYVAIAFEVTDTSQHYHVPLLLSPFGYSTYRGS